MLLPNPLSIVMAAACGLVLLRLILSFKSLLYLLIRWWRSVDEWAQVYQRYEIPRYTEVSAENPLYRKALVYVCSLPSLEDAAAVQVSSSASKTNDFAFHLGPDQTAQDSFLGARVAWTNAGDERLVIRLRRRDRTRVLRPYLQHVESVADEIEQRRRDLRLFTNSNARGWASVPFTHPATLDTVAMDADLMARIRADLEAFLKARAYYHRLGRVWRRSYLLYGPPGTGKSTFAAAMARFLSFDVYDLDLAREDDANLRDLLIHTTPKSLILIENLDLYLNNNNNNNNNNSNGRIKKLLDFMDGILSCCGEERVMVFTISSDSKDELDPAVLRPGRLDVHIHFPMCDFNAFKNLANSYLGLKEHKLYPQVEEGFYSGGRISQAEVGEIMIANKGSPSRAIKSVISVLQLARFSTRREEEVAINGGEGSIGFGKELAPLKEFKKLYGLIKIKSGIKRDAIMPTEDREQPQQG